RAPQRPGDPVAATPQCTLDDPASCMTSPLQTSSLSGLSPRTSICIQPTSSSAGPGTGSGASKSTGTRTQPSTGLPSWSAGCSLHFLAASTVAASNTPAGSDCSTTTSLTRPPVSTSSFSTTRPPCPAATASAG